MILCNKKYLKTLSKFRTQLGMVLGTPEYISPEQASGDPTKVGKSSDIYSLGAILYSILTGNAPSGNNAFLTSERIKNAKQTSHPSAKERNPAVPVALNAICLRAMQPNAVDRYTTSSELSEDLDNWLSDKPILARPDSSLERAARFLRTHRRWAAAATISLIFASIGSLIAATTINNQSRELEIRKSEAETQAKVQMQLAEREAENARIAQKANVDNASYVNFMSDFFKNLEPEKSGGETKLATALDKISTSLEDNNNLSGETRRDVLANIASGYLAAREDKKALDATIEYNRRTEDMYGPNNSVSVDASGALVVAYNHNSYPKKGLSLANRTLEIIRTTEFSADKLKRINELEKAIMRHRLTSLQMLERFDDLRIGWEEYYPPLLDLDLDNLPTTGAELHFASQYVEVLRKSGDEDRALEWQKKIYHAQKRIMGPKDTGTLGNLYRLSQAIQNTQGHKAALPYREELVELASEVMGAEHPNTLAARTNLASSLYFLGQYQESFDRLIELREIWLKKGTALPNLLIVETKLGRVLLMLGKEEQALELFESVAKRAKESTEIDEASKTNTIAQYFLSLAQIENGQFQDALQTIENEIDIFTESGMTEEATAADLQSRLQLVLMLQIDFGSALKTRDYFSDKVSHDTIVESAQTAETLFNLEQFDEAKNIMEEILSLPAAVNEQKYFVARSNCIRANIKGLLSQIIAEAHPQRSEQLLVEAVKELHEGFTVIMPNTRVQLPLQRHSNRLIEMNPKAIPTTPIYGVLESQTSNSQDKKI